MAKPKKQFAFLTLDNGEQITLEYNVKYFGGDDVTFDAIDEAFRNQTDSFYTEEYESLSATFRGHFLTFINFRRVIALTH